MHCSLGSLSRKHMLSSISHMNCLTKFDTSHPPNFTMVTSRLFWCYSRTSSGFHYKTWSKVLMGSFRLCFTTLHFISRLSKSEFKSVVARSINGENVAVFCYTVSDTPKVDSMTQVSSLLVWALCSSRDNLMFCTCHGRSEWDIPYTANHEVFKCLDCRTCESDWSRFLVLVFFQQYLVVLEL